MKYIDDSKNKSKKVVRSFTEISGPEYMPLLLVQPGLMKQF